MPSNESKIIARMKKKSADAYAKVKDTEAQAGGRKLPGGLENERAMLIDAKFDENRYGKAYFMLYYSAETPDEYKGVNGTLYYSLEANDFQTEDECMQKLSNDMQLLGFDTTQFDNSIELCIHVKQTIKKQKKRPFLYDTGTRTNDKGEYRTFVADSREMDDDGGEEERKPRRGKAKRPSPFVVGDRVETTGDYYGDGNTYYGVVEAVDGGTISVRFDDDNALDEIPAANLIKSAGEGEEPEDEEGGENVPFEEGDAVVTTGDYFEVGEEYEGTVVSVNDDGTATVEFEDGETDVPLKNLEPAS